MCSQSRHVFSRATLQVEASAIASSGHVNDRSDASLPRQLIAAEHLLRLDPSDQLSGALEWSTSRPQQPIPTGRRLQHPVHQTVTVDLVIPVHMHRQRVNMRPSARVDHTEVIREKPPPPLHIHAHNPSLAHAPQSGEQHRLATFFDRAAMGERSPLPQQRQLHQWHVDVENKPLEPMQVRTAAMRVKVPPRLPHSQGPFLDDSAPTLNNRHLDPPPRPIDVILEQAVSSGEPLFPHAVAIELTVFHSRPARQPVHKLELNVRRIPAVLQELQQP